MLEDDGKDADGQIEMACETDAADVAKCSKNCYPVQNRRKQWQTTM